MAYIDKDLLLKDISESVVFSVRSAETSPELRGARKIIDRIKNTPTADVVEVVKCKDCIYCNKDSNECFMHSEEDYIFTTVPFDFCSYGERRDT